LIFSQSSFYYVQWQGIPELVVSKKILYLLS
jgi:hypothetical protein